MKKKPSLKYEKETGRKSILGILADESHFRYHAWLRNGCNAFDSPHPKSTPLAFWTDQDILMYLKLTEIPYASVYGEIIQDKNGKLRTTGAQRTGCMFCGFGIRKGRDEDRFVKLKQTHPKVWGCCMKPWDKGGLGMKEVLDYINVRYE